jgi:hypothetical protein
LSDTDGTIFVSLRAFGWTLAFTGCPDVADGLESILYGWDVRRRSTTKRRNPDAHVIKTRNGYRWRSAAMPKPAGWARDPPRSTMDAIWDVHDVLFDWLLKKNPRYLCLHAAAVRIGKSLVCFPSVQKAGKSTLCMQLVARRHLLYCDDVLPIEPRDKGVAMGIAPLLRKPLPVGLGSRLARFVKARMGPSDRRWTYVKLKHGEIAPLGQTALVRALVLLHRERRAGARLEPVSTSEMLREILLQNFAKHVPPVETLDRLLQIAERAACYRLRYRRVADAARLLERTFR